MKIDLSSDELHTVANALNEVCNGIWFTDSEFQTRIGVDRAEAESVLDKILSAIESSTDHRPAVGKIDD